MHLLQQLSYIFNSRDRLEGLMLLFAMVFGALFEVIGIGLVIPFLALLREPHLAFDATLARALLIPLGIREPSQLIFAMGFGLISVFLLKSTYLVFTYQWLFRYVFDQQVRLERRLLTGYLSMPYAFRLERNSAELIKTTTGTVQRFCTGFLIGFIIVVGELLVVLAVMTLLVIAAPLLTFGALLTMGIPVTLIYLVMKRRLAVSGHVAEQSMTLMIKWTEQALNGMKETLVTGRAPFFIERTTHHAREYAECQKSAMLFSTFPRLVIDTLAVAALVISALVITEGGTDPQSILPSFVVFAVAAMRLMPSATRIANGLTQLRFHYAAVEVLYSELCTIDRNASGARETMSPSMVSARPFERCLRLAQVSFCYPGTLHPAIDQVTLEIPKGCWIGFIGPTGAGKSTLIDLILGLCIPTSGRILIDGNPLETDVRGWQRNIGFVPQNVYVFDDSICRNVAFGVEDHDIDETRVWEALRAAQIEKFVKSLPCSIDTIVGERGDRLSGGERQRLGIARALYRDPQVLVVDEGTANLDAETEAAIAQTLAGLRGQKTIIVVAHRLALVAECDNIYLLSNGRILKSGAFLDLISPESGLRKYFGTVA